MNQSCEAKFRQNVRMLRSLKVFNDGSVHNLSPRLSLPCLQGSKGKSALDRGCPLAQRDHLSSKSKFDPPQHTQPLGVARFKPSVRFISLED